MPKIGMRETLKLSTRSEYSKVDFEMGVTVEGNELPNLAVLGEALEAALTAFQLVVKESYVKVPERV